MTASSIFRTALFGALLPCGCTFSIGDFAEPVVPAPPLVYVAAVRAPFTVAHPGQVGLPLEVDVVNDGAEALALRNLVVVPSRDLGAVTWAVSRPYPHELPPAGRTTVALYIGLDAFLPPGAITFNAAGFATAADGTAHTVDQAEEPAAVDVRAAVLAQADQDDDVLTDEQEATLGTDPTDPDSDSDGLSDGVEAALAVPYDSDGDTLIDALEDDADDGGEPDLLEWRRGSNPRSAADDRSYATLVVTDAGDGMDGDPLSLADAADAGPTLSLREALTIATNRAGPDRVTVDTAAVTTPIIADGTPASTTSHWPVLSDDDTFIDGAGARIEWRYSGPVEVVTLVQSSAARLSIRNLTIDSLRVGYEGTTFYAQILGDGALGLTAAALRCESSGLSSSGVAVRLQGARSAFVYRITTVRGAQQLIDGVVLNQTIGARLVANELSVSRSGVSLVGTSGLDRQEIVRNRIAASLSGDAIVVAGSNVDVRDNEITTAHVGIFVNSSNDCTVWDNRIFETSSHGIHVFSLSKRNSLHRNSLSSCADKAIEVSPGAQEGMVAPAIAAVEVTRVYGSHLGGDGTLIEVFADPADDAEIYAGATTVVGGAWEVILTAPLPQGYLVSATATDAAGNTSALSTPAMPVP